MGNTLPYLGVSEITKFNEACLIADFFIKNFISVSDVNYTPIIGFPMSRESSIPGLLNRNENEYVSTNALIKKIEKIAVATKKIVGGMICYTTKEQEKLPEDIVYIYNQLMMNGIERDSVPIVRLDAVNFRPYHLEKLARAIYPNEISLLVSRSFIGCRKPSQVGEEVERFKDYTRYALIELRNGWASNKKDAGRALEIHGEIREKCPAINLGFAGRINGAGKDQLKEIFFRLSSGMPERLSFDSIGRTDVMAKDGKSMDTILYQYILSGNERINAAVKKS